jgi:hypothetical protein
MTKSSGYHGSAIAIWTLCLSALSCSKDRSPEPIGPTVGSTRSTGKSVASTDSGAAKGVSGAIGLARRLRRPHFLIGMGNDLADNHDQDGAYTLGVTLDIHYAYLVGLRGKGGWPDWNTNGTFVNILADTAKRHGVIPMFTLYAMAAAGEANAKALTDDGYMRPYWEGAKLLFQRLADFGDACIVHFEPDFWGFAQKSQEDPSKLDVHVSSLAPDCAQQPNSAIGMGRCLLTLARKYSPKAVVGFHASAWAHREPAKIAEYLLALGAGDSDFVVIETLDRDAGCFEAGNDANCTRKDGPWYWDETNQTSPNFHEHLAWAKVISRGVGKPLLWWQMPFGVPSVKAGGSPGRYRDNRVKYLFEHTDEFVAAGGVGAVFGVGSGNQTYITTDGGQFKRAVTKYFANPTTL